MRTANVARLGVSAAIGLAFGSPLDASWFVATCDTLDEAIYQHERHVALSRLAAENSD